MADAWGGAWGSAWGASWGATVSPAEDTDIFLGGGTYQGYREALAREDKDRDNRWRKRRRQLAKIADLLDGIKEEVPSDVPEAAVARQAEAAVEEAAERLAEDVPAPAFDYAGLAAAIRQADAAVRQAQAAFVAYQARKQREMDEQDDEDVLLLMA